MEVENVDCDTEVEERQGVKVENAVNDDNTKWNNMSAIS